MNSLQTPMNASTATETQPDGTLYQYGSLSGGALSLQYIQNPAGQRWTVTYDGSGRVSFVTDPITRRTTLSYDATSGKISSIQDPLGRRTTLTVNGSGDLVQVLSPELCVTSMVYDSSHRMLAWINPLGDRTSFAYGSSQLVLTSPLGAVTTLVSSPVTGGAFRPRIPGTTFTNVTNPLGNVATLGFDTNGNLVGATDARGEHHELLLGRYRSPPEHRRWIGERHELWLCDQRDEQDLLPHVDHAAAGWDFYLRVQQQRPGIVDNRSARRDLDASVEFVGTAQRGDRCARRSDVVYVQQHGPARFRPEPGRAARDPGV